MIIAINNNKIKKLIIVIIMIISMIYIQCVIPCFQAHALVITATAVALAALASVLLICGIKLMPTGGNPLSEIYKDIYTSIRTVKKAQTAKTNALMDWLETNGSQIGDTAPILKADLQSMKSELTSALEVDPVLTDYKAYDGQGTQLSDVKVTNDAKQVFYERVSDTLVEGTRTFLFTNNQTSLYNAYMTVKADDPNSIFDAHFRYKKFTYMKIALTYSGSRHRMSIDLSGTYYDNSDGETGQTTQNFYVYSSEIAQKTDLKVIFSYLPEYNTAYSWNGGITGSTSQQRVKATLWGGNPAVELCSSTLWYGGVDNAWKETAVSYVDDYNLCKAKVVPGVYTQAVAVADAAGTTPETKSISVTFPNSLTPELASVCPELKTKLDTLDGTTFDYDNLKTHEWDEVNDTETTIPADPAITDGTTQTDTGTETQTGTETVVPDIGKIEDYPKIDDLKIPNTITTKFPFSIPWDIQRCVNVLVATPTPPVFVLPFKIGDYVDEEITIDLTQFETVATITRFFTMIIFTFGLVMGTRKYIGQ